MEQSGFLIGLGQLALVLAGFISIFLFASTQDGKLSRPDAIHFMTMTFASVGVLVGCLMPVFLNAVGLAELTAWRAAAAIMFAIETIFGGYITFKTLRLSGVERREVGHFHMVASYALALSGGLFLGLAGVGINPDGYYLAALVLTMFLGVLGFFTFTMQSFVFNK